jgi:hypothetical protein
MHMYRVLFLKGDTEIASVPWGSDLALAKNHARDHFIFFKRENKATTAQIVELKTGQKVYEFPE